MKTKGKEAEKKRRKEEKRSEEKKVMSGIELRTSDTQAKALPLGHVEHTLRIVEISLLKPSTLIKREFKDIFQKNDCSFDSENPT